MATNLGWEFYKGYFRNFTDDDYILSIKKEKTDEEKESLKTKLNIDNLFKIFDIIEDEKIGNIHFEATTTYPGLLVGSGYLHELPDVKEQLILGFDFDYTTGLPIIRGSSIKGVLRSVFPLNKDKLEMKIKNLEKKSKFEEIEILKKDNISKSEYIQEILNDKNIDILELEKEIFENNDIFYDAQIIKIQNKLLEDDYITPHNDITKNPIPLRFLKVAPNVTFRFDFELSDGIISKEKKRELFKTILEDLGIGAKTNVGYGKFENFETILTEEEKLQVELKRKEEEIKAELKRKEDKFQEVIKSENIEELERFKIDYQYNIEEIDSIIKELKNNLEIAEIQRAFNNLDKSNSRHIESFINKYKSNEKAQQFINQLKNSNSKQNNTSFDDILKITKFKQLAKKLKNVNLNDEEKAQLKEHLLNNMEKLKKRKDFPFAQLKPIFGEDEANKLADELELK